LRYIGFSKKISNLVIAGGHAMSGLSLGPATGKLAEELVNGKAGAIMGAAQAAKYSRNILGYAIKMVKP
jgi:glycine/D-amino acid oxidase-like deaminating enzyme